MPPASSDTSVGRARGPVGTARRIREPRSRTPRTTFRTDDGRRSEQRAVVPSVRSDENSALETLLVDLGSQIQRGVSKEAAEPLGVCPTGLAVLDARLGGGFPRGRLSEICGPRQARRPSPSATSSASTETGTAASSQTSGRTSLALQLLRETLQGGGLVAWIDWADAFDPISAAVADDGLDRLLWVRARSADEALRSSERLLRTEGFELVVLDQAFAVEPDPPPGRPRRTTKAGATRSISDVAWLRLARLAAGTRTALVVLSRQSTTGSRAELVLEMQPLRPHFTAPPSRREALETTAVIQRHRTRPTGQEVPLSIDAEPQADTPPNRSASRKAPREAR